MCVIPSKSLLRSWFNKIVQHPSFINTLNEYQKSELVQYCKEEVINNYKLASEELLKNTPTNELVYKISTTNEAISILNLLGCNWVPDKGFYKIEEPQRKAKLKKWKNAPIKDINAKWEYLINEGEALTQRQIALVCLYEGIHIPKPSDSYQIANQIAKFHGHKSGLDLYNNHYLKVRSDTDRLNQHQPKKTKKDIETVINFLSSGENINKALKDLRKLDDKIRHEEN